MNITLDIFFHTEETSNMEDAGLDYDIEDCEIRQITFYQISHIKPRKEGKKWFTAICANATEYVSPITYDKVKAEIDKHLSRY